MLSSFMVDIAWYLAAQQYKRLSSRAPGHELKISHLQQQASKLQSQGFHLELKTQRDAAIINLQRIIAARHVRRLGERLPDQTSARFH